jgi:3-hydroxybutyryl-CoA dehydrogenase
MAHLLLLGPSNHIQQFARRVDPSHRCHALPSDGSELLPLDNLALLDGESDITFDAVFELSVGDVLEKELNLEAILEHVAADVPVFVNALTMTATEAAAQLGGEGPVIGISFTAGTFASATHLEVAPALQNSEQATVRALDLLRTLLPLDVEVVVDRVGLVSMRILAMVINEAAFALMEGVADAADIDTAMQLGTNYPQGPLAWADAIGIDEVLAVLQALHDEYQEERYRPCVLLKQYARAGRAVKG